MTLPAPQNFWTFAFSCYGMVLTRGAGASRVSVPWGMAAMVAAVRDQPSGWRIIAQK